MRLLIESGRFLIYLISAVLEAGQDPTRRETWLTTGLLKKTMTLFGMSSGRNIDHLVAPLCQVGYMQSTAPDLDRRVRILSPTEKLRSHDRDWQVAHFVPLTILYPHHDYELVIRRDVAFHTLFRRTGLMFLPLAAKLYLSEPDMLLFMSRSGGYMVIAALLQAAMAHEDPLHVAVPYAHVGDRFGISRTHVRNLLMAAEEGGMVKVHGRGGRRVEILPRLWASHDRAMAAGMYIHDMIHVATMKAHATAG